MDPPRGIFEQQNSLVSYIWDYLNNFDMNFMKWITVCYYLNLSGMYRKLYLQLSVGKMLAILVT